MLKIFKNYSLKTSILGDFTFYVLSKNYEGKETKATSSATTIGMPNLKLIL